MVEVRGVLHLTTCPHYHDVLVGWGAPIRGDYQGFKQDYYDGQVRGFQNPGFMNNRRGYPDYNISTSNQFYPLSDLEGPLTQSNSRDGQNGVVSQPHPVLMGSIVDGGNPGPSGSNYQQCGFHRPSQGTKRSVDQREDLEGRGDCNLKRKKT